MITLHELIVNELESCLYHKPTQAELNAVSDFLATKQLRWFVDVELAIVDWKDAYTKECANCGDRYLESEMIKDGDKWFCCEEHKENKD